MSAARTQTTTTELPPGIDAPSPPAERDRIASGDGMPDGVEAEIRRLADTVGGWDRLRTAVDRLATEKR